MGKVVICGRAVLTKCPSEEGNQSALSDSDCESETE